jgi:hypothetical protein
VCEAEKRATDLCFRRSVETSCDAHFVRQSSKSIFDASFVFKIDLQIRFLTRVLSSLFAKKYFYRSFDLQNRVLTILKIDNL